MAQNRDDRAEATRVQTSSQPRMSCAKVGLSLPRRMCVALWCWCALENTIHTYSNHSVVNRARLHNGMLCGVVYAGRSVWRCCALLNVMYPSIRTIHIHPCAIYSLFAECSCTRDFGSARLEHCYTPHRTLSINHKPVYQKPPSCFATRTRRHAACTAKQHTQTHTLTGACPCPHQRHIRPLPISPSVCVLADWLV